MTWWIYALLSAVCWGLQYVLMEALFRRVDFAAAFCFLSLVNGLLVAGLMFILYPNQNWHQLWRSWPVAGLIVLYLLCGSGAYLFNAYAINAKNATLASLLEISYPLFIILFTAIFFQKVHLNAFGFLGASLIFAGCLLVVLSRSR
jgi:drug/metabolite transporter (DMT)-like permease